MQGGKVIKFIWLLGLYAKQIVGASHYDDVSNKTKAKITPKLLLENGRAPEYSRSLQWQNDITKDWSPIPYVKKSHSWRLFVRTSTININTLLSHRLFQNGANFISLNRWNFVPWTWISSKEILNDVCCSREAQPTMCLNIIAILHKQYYKWKNNNLISSCVSARQYHAILLVGSVSTNSSPDHL